MIFTAKRNDLIDALDACCKIAGKNRGIAILSNIRITIKDQHASFEASSTDLSIRKTFDVVADGDADFLIDAQSVSRYIKLVHHDDVRFDVDIHTCKVSHPKGHITIAITGTTQWPNTQIDNNDQNTLGISIPASFLSTAIDKGSAFLSTDTTHPQMNALHLIASDGKIYYDATDTRRLIRESFDCPESLSGEVLIARETLPMLTQALGLVDCCSFVIGENNVLFKLGNTTISQTKLVYRYPNVERIIPKNISIEAVFDRKELVDAIRRVTLTVQGTSIVNVDFTLGLCTLKVMDVEGGKNLREDVPCECCGEAKIALSGSFAIDCLAAIDDDKVSIRLTDTGKPMFFYGESTPNRTIILMPMTRNE